MITCWWLTKKWRLRGRGHPVVHRVVGRRRGDGFESLALTLPCCQLFYPFLHFILNFIQGLSVSCFWDEECCQEAQYHGDAENSNHRLPHASKCLLNWRKWVNCREWSKPLPMVAQEISEGWGREKYNLCYLLCCTYYSKLNKDAFINSASHLKIHGCQPLRCCWKKAKLNPFPKPTRCLPYIVAACFLSFFGGGGGTTALAQTSTGSMHASNTSSKHPIELVEASPIN